MTIRLMFEWGGGSLWAGDDAARARFDVGPLDDALDLPDALRSRLDALSVRHDTALDWDDPAGPSPWTDSERAAFDTDAEVLRRDLSAHLATHLGPSVALVYVPL